MITFKTAYLFRNQIGPNRFFSSNEMNGILRSGVIMFIYVPIYYVITRYNALS